MTIFYLDTPHRAAADTAALSAAAAAFGSGRMPVVLAPAFDDAVRLKKQCAQMPASLGISVTTFSRWLEDIWELAGDGRTFVEAPFRLAAIAACAAEGGGGLPGAGAAAMMASMAQEALPLIGADEDLTEAECGIVAVMERYSAVLAREGLIERSQALDSLERCCSERLKAFAVFVLVRTEGTLTVLERRFLGSIGATLVRDGLAAPGEPAASVGQISPGMPYEQGKLAPDMPPPAAASAAPPPAAAPASTASPAPHRGTPGRAPELAHLQKALFNPDPAHPVSATGALRFVFPAGPGAEIQALAETLSGLCAELPEGDIMVACRDAARTFADAAPRLVRKGIGTALDARVPFAHTDVGRAVVQVLSLVKHTPVPDTFLATDYAFNPFSQMSLASAFYFDAHWRNNRLIEGDDILTDLSCNGDDELRGVIGSFENDRPQDAVDQLTTYVYSRNDWAEAYRAEQLGALSAARECFAACSHVGLSAQEALPLLAGQTVRRRARIGSGRVRFCSLEDAASAPVCSCAALVVCDLTASAYPVKAEGSAKQQMFSKLGIAEEDDALAQMRRVFFHALETPTDRLVLMRPLNGPDGEPACPAAFFEEVTDCYRISPTDSGELDPTFALPEALMRYAGQRTEMPLVANATGEGPPPAAHKEPYPKLGAISAANRGIIVLPRRYKEGRTFPGLDLSPSQIESYLECPYQWFTQRRIGLGVPDEQLGPLERGTFVHTVLRRFYERFIQEGQGKVGHENLARAEEVLAEEFDEQAAHEYERPRGGRYVPVGQWEARQRASLRQALCDYLAPEAALLPTFTPRHFEWEFGTDEPIRYAGCNILGTVDRIDVDDAAHTAVVIDYKTGLGPDYDLRPALPTEGFVLPRKMQALIYARTVEEVLGYRVVGALYVNPLKSQAAGAFDGTVLDPAHLLAINADRNRVPFGPVTDFAGLLDAAEAAVEKRLAHLAAGEIAPGPSGRGVCRYCPVALCPERLS